jgi:L-asparaginase II
MGSGFSVEVLRGGRVESRHGGTFVVADAEGGIVLSAGDPDRAIYPRSAVKALQALPLLVSGAADRFGLSEAEIALSCASHCGSPVHAATAERMLARAGRETQCLECGAHWPSSAGAARALAAEGGLPSALHNNCSGKHAGFVCTAVATGQDPAGYVAAEHPVMVAVTRAMGEVLAVRLESQAPAVDGCSIPVFMIPMRALAAGFARFGTGRGLPAEFAAAAPRLRRAVAANPQMLAGEGLFDSVVSAALGEAAFIKGGAEGVYCGALPALGLGFALKCDDGAARAAEVAVACLLRRLLGAHPVLDRLAAPVLTNWNGVVVGEMRATLD